VKLGVENVPVEVSTGRLPGWAKVEEHVEEAYESAKSVTDGDVNDSVPALAAADPDLFGICVAEVNGECHDAGDSTHEFSIQSISKAFVWALVGEHLGHGKLLELVGVNNTGMPFNSVMALELKDGHPMNPMVNAGALATTALAPGKTPTDQWEFIQDGLSRFAGRDLVLDNDVYASEKATNERNDALAHLLQNYGRIDSDPLELVDVYTKQCSLLVSAHDLAIMGATLANGGVNPVSGNRVVSASVCHDTLAVLATSGLYEKSGEWLFEIGIPAKSGITGGLVAVAPGKAGIATFSPRLDSAGNSVRGQRATALLSRTLGLDLFASAVHHDDDVQGDDEDAADSTGQSESA